MVAFGNFVHECGVIDRLSKTMENELLNIVSILLSLGVGSQMTPEKIMNPNSLGIIALGLLAFCIATAGGVLMAKLMNVFLPKGKKINPLIGSAGVSAVPMAARVSNKVGQEADPSNFLLMNAMGPNVAASLALLLQRRVHRDIRCMSGFRINDAVIFLLRKTVCEVLQAVFLCIRQILLPESDL